MSKVYHLIGLTLIIVVTLANLAIMKASRHDHIVIENEVNIVELAKHLRKNSVLVRCMGANGSGILTELDGENYVITAQHVCAINRRVSPDGKFICYNPITIIYGDSQQTVDSEVIKISKKKDIAVLRTLTKITDDKVKFDTSSQIPVPGVTVYHIGSPRGLSCYNVFARGMMSKANIINDGTSYDYINCMAQPGSSGGGIFNNKGDCLGYVVGTFGETINVVFPAREIKSWLHKHEMGRIMDSTEKPWVDIDGIEVDY